MLDVIVFLIAGAIAIFGATYAVWGITRSWIEYRRGLIGEEFDRISFEGGIPNATTPADRTPSHTV